MVQKKDSAQDHDAQHDHDDIGPKRPFSPQARSPAQAAGCLNHAGT